MFGIIIEVIVEPNREGEARAMLNNMVLPRAKGHTGIVAGYWLRDVGSDILRSIQIYDTEINAKETAEKIRAEGPPPGAPVRLVSVNNYEVIAQL